MRTGRADSRCWSRAASALDPKTAALLQVGASVAIGSPAVCLERSASRALAAGASENQIADVLLSLAPSRNSAGSSPLRPRWRPHSGMTSRPRWRNQAVTDNCGLDGREWP